MHVSSVSLPPQKAQVQVTKWQKYLQISITTFSCRQQSPIKFACTNPLPRAKALQYQTVGFTESPPASLEGRNRGADWDLRLTTTPNPTESWGRFLQNIPHTNSERCLVGNWSSRSRWPKWRKIGPPVLVYLCKYFCPMLFQTVIKKGLHPAAICLPRQLPVLCLQLPWRYRDSRNKERKQKNSGQMTKAGLLVWAHALFCRDFLKTVLDNAPGDAPLLEQSLEPSAHSTSPDRGFGCSAKDRMKPLRRSSASISLAKRRATLAESTGWDAVSFMLPEHKGSEQCNRILVLAAHEADIPASSFL